MPDTEAVLAALDTLAAYLAERNGPRPTDGIHLHLWGDGTGTIGFRDRQFGNCSEPIAAAIADFGVWLGGGDASSLALDSEIGEPVDRIFA